MRRERKRWESGWSAEVWRWFRGSSSWFSAIVVRLERAVALASKPAEEGGGSGMVGSAIVGGMSV